MRHGDIVLGGDLSSHTVDYSCGNGEVSASFCAGTSEICFGEILEECDDGGRFAVGEEKSNVAD